jgi:hypothetical protein
MNSILTSITNCSFTESVFFFIGALSVWLILWVRQRRFMHGQSKLKTEIGQLRDNVIFLKNQLERKDQAINRFIGQLNSQNAADAKRIIVGIRKFENISESGKEHPQAEEGGV